jgi:hypothetical protein
MSPLEPNQKNRSYLLPAGCKDLHDVLQAKQSELSFPEFSRERIALLAIAACDLMNTSLTEEQRGRVYSMLIHACWLFLRAQQHSVSAGDDGERAVEFAQRLLASPGECERLLDEFCK